MRVRRKYIRSVAERLIASHSRGSTPIDVKYLASALGINIRSTRPGDVSLSGFLVRDDGTGKAIIGINEAHHENRKRFTIAHEIGHFLLHTGQEIYVGECSKSGLRVSLRNEDSSKGTERDEIEANVFAAELLMPLKLLHDNITSADISDEESLEKVLEELSEKYGASKQALTYRLVNLGYIHL
jgi:Zn-dependent peptidase ImmA (M78 family)